MAPRDNLHRLVDALPESELERAERVLEALRQVAEAPYRPLEDALLDNEPEMSEERAAVDEARSDIAAGRVISHEEAKRRWGL
jgi:predicted transcriptional regulator